MAQARRRTTSISTASKLRYRTMRESDLEQILQIETRTYPFPWTKEYFSHCLKTGTCCRVLERHGVIEAYGIMSVAADKADILNLCVRPASQRRGLGRRMLTHLIEFARRCRAETVCLEVRFSNLPARRLYQSMGFKEIGIEKDYYRLAQGCEDALIMARPLSSTQG
jgi:ribosomal-protein-alanine N-acetyltransferase